MWEEKTSGQVLKVTDVAQLQDRSYGSLLIKATAAVATFVTIRIVVAFICYMAQTKLYKSFTFSVK